MVDLANSCKKNNSQKQGKTSQFYIVKTYRKQRKITIQMRNEMRGGKQRWIATSLS